MRAPLPGEIRRLLVVKPSSFGDILHVFPALAAMRRVMPGVKLDFLVNPAFEKVLDYSPWPVDRVIRFERKRLGEWRHTPEETWKLIRALRRERYDLILDFQGLMRSAFFAFCAKGGPVAGFSDPREGSAKCFYRVRIPVEGSLHAVERNLRLADALTGCGTDLIRPELPVLPGEEFPGLPERYVAVGIGARWESKSVPVPLFGQVLRESLSACPGEGVVIVGTGEDSPRSAALKAELSGFPVLDLAGKSDFRQLMGVLRRADAVICCDSGPMHAAALLGRPVLALFGATKPERTGPLWPGSRVFRREDLECIGCMQRVCPRKRECFELDPSPVAAALISAVRSGAPKGASI